MIKRYTEMFIAVLYNVGYNNAQAWASYIFNTIHYMHIGNVLLQSIHLTYHLVHNVLGPKLLQIMWFLLEPWMFSHEFYSVLALMDIVSIQALKFFCEYLQGDLTAEVLSLRSFVLYGIATIY